MLAMVENELDTLGIENVLQPSMDLQTDLLKTFVELTDPLPKEENGACPNLSDVRETLLNHVLEKVELYLETDACSIYIIDAPGFATMRAARGYQNPNVGKSRRRIVPASEVKDKPTQKERLGLTSWIISTGRSFLATQPEDFFNHVHWSGQFDKSTDDASDTPEAKRTLAAFLGIPLRNSRGQVIGALKAQRSMPNEPFSVENQITLEALGQVAGRCIAYVDDAQNGPVNASITSWALKIFSDASTAEGELDSFLDIAVRVIAAASQADACSVFLIDESKRTLTQRAGCGHQSLKNTIRSYELPERSTLDDCYTFEICNPATCEKISGSGLSEDKKVGITAWVAATGKTFYANSKDELRQHCHHKGHFDRENFNRKEEEFLEECSAWFGVPLIVGGTTIGVLKIENKTPFQVIDSRQFSTEVKQQLEILAQDIAISIRRLQIQSKTRYEVINKAMPTILTILQGGHDVSELVKSVVRETAKLFNARACALFLKEGNQLIQPEWAAVGYAIQAGSNEAGYTVRKYDLVPVEAIEDNPNPSKEEADKRVGLTVWIAVTKQKFSARSNQELTLHPHHKGTFDDKNFREQEKCESFMGVPLLVGEQEQKELIGVLKVETKQRINGDRVDYSYFNEQDSLVFDLIANSVAIAIQNARLLAARKLADRLLAQSNRYNTLKEIFGVIDQRVDVISTLENAAVSVKERDAKKALMIDSVAGILRPDFNVAILNQFAHQIRDSKDTNCIALTSLFELMSKMMRVKNLAEIHQIDPAENTPRGIHDPNLVLYDAAKIILDTHQMIAEHLKRYERERYHIVELKNSLSLLEKEIETAKNLTLFKQNTITRIFSHWKNLILKELAKQREVKNPYIAGVPLEASSSVFYGREEIFKWIDDSLHEQKAVLILHGGWHTGKTSILKQIQAGPFGEYIRDRNSAVPVYIDLQGIPDSSVGIFLLNLADQIYQALDSSEVPNPDDLENSFEKTPYRTFDKFLNVATSVLAKQGKKYLIVMLDEFEKLDTRVQQEKLDAEIFNYLRSKMQHHKALSFILAGRHRLEEMTSEFRNIIFNVGYHKEVGFLDAAEAQRLITEPVKPYAVTYSNECVERIMKLTAGHPFFIQQLCQMSITLLNKRKKGYEVDAEILSQAVDDVLKHNSVLSELWSSELCEEDRKLFIGLSDLIDQDDKWIEEAEIVKYSNLTADNIAQALQKPIIQKFIVQRELEKDKTEYAFGVDILRLWIKNSKPIQQPI